MTRAVLELEDVDALYRQLRVLAVKYSYREGRRQSPTTDQLNRFFDLAVKVFESVPIYDVIGIEALEERLRMELMNIHGRDDDLNSINKLSAYTGISRTYLARFRDGDSVSMNVMNRIASAFGICYLIGNYEERT